MKKSFKKVVAILLAVMMIVCSVPLTVFASDDANRANINLQFGDVSCSTTKKTVLKPRATALDEFLKHSGLNSDKLTYSNGKIDGYATGDFFTVSVLLENVTELSAAEVAIKYSEAIEPAYIRNYSGRQGTVVAAMYNETFTEGPYAEFPINEAVPSQSGNALYNSTSTLGETSYVDPEARIMHANFAVQTGADSVSLADSKAVLATFMFKIVNDQPITFSIDNTQSDPYETYTLGTIANGGKVEEYKTYAKVSETDVPALDFMGENEYNGTVGKNYTITFVDADGQQISSAEYKEGTAIVPPSLPATTHDDAQHYTYAWDKEVPATATANGTYTIIKTGAAHTWDAGVVTTEPTTTTTGVKTYTCTFDGCGATRTEELPKKEDAHVHHYTWTYDDSKLYYNKLNDRCDGEIVGTCECGDVKREVAKDTSKLRCNSYALVFDSSLTIDFRMSKKNVTSFNNIVVKANTLFTKNDKGELTPIVFTEPDSSADTYYHYNVGVWPQYIKDDVDVVAYATVTASDGTEVEVHGPTYSRAIKTYTDIYVTNPAYYNANANAKDRALTATCVDVLNYAAAAQIYSDTDVNNLANADLNEDVKKLATPDISSFATIKNYHAVPLANQSARFMGHALSLEEAVIPRMSFALKRDMDVNDIEIRTTVNGRTKTYSMADKNASKEFKLYNPNANGALGPEKRYYFFFPGVYANEMKEEIRFTIYDKNTGEQLSSVCTYSVESYLGEAYSSSDAKLQNLLMSVMKYGTSAKYYGSL